MPEVNWLDVSMHLLVLSAFRQDGQPFHKNGLASQCTFWCSVLSDRTGHRSVHPVDVSQCTFWCSVLSDLRQLKMGERCGFGLNAPSGAQCFPTLPSSCQPSPGFLSQCTFWCSVLSDSAPRKPRHTTVYRNEIAADLESTTSNRPAHVQLNHATAKNRHKTPSAADAPYPPVRHRLPTNPSQKTDTSQLRHGKHRNQGHRRLPPRRHDGPLPADRFAWADRRIPLTSPSR